MKDKIEFGEFQAIEKKLEITIGTITEVERVPKSTKMLKMTVDFGGEDIRTVVTNIGDKFSEVELRGIKAQFVTNLPPAKIMGIESSAMIMVASHGADTFILGTYDVIPNGSKIL